MISINLEDEIGMEIKGRSTNILTEYLALTTILLKDG